MRTCDKGHGLRVCWSVRSGVGEELVWGCGADGDGSECRYFRYITFSA